MMNTEALTDIARFYKRLQWLLLAAAVFWLVMKLGTVLTPFVVAALLGWLGDPLVRRLQRAGLSRNTAVILVFVLMLVLIASLLLVLMPMLQSQLVTLVESLPAYRDWFVGTAVPWVEQQTGLALARWLDPDFLLKQIPAHWDRAGGVAGAVVAYVSRSGFALMAWMANLVLIPVLTFFFLRDWDVFIERIASLIPRDHLPTVSKLAGESDSMLGGFLRGQFTVMLILGAMYGIGLWMVGLDLGLLIGVIAGLLTFIPFVGPTSGLVMGVVAALVQFGDWKHVASVLVVFGIGQVVESYWLTPKLVGNRIGLHPMAVIFAVLAGGQLFGFVGMLLALPVAAVANVLLHYARDRYTQSRLYAGENTVGEAGVIVDADAVATAAAVVPQSPKGADPA